MSAATLVFTDIVGFSKKPTAEQKRLVTALTGELVHEVRLFLNPPMDVPSAVALPTGDGVALAFLHRANQPWDRSTIFRVILRIQRWASTEPGVRLRVGVHVGPVELVSDINGRANICGDTINYAQRVMDASNASQVLFSEAAVREYVGGEGAVITAPPFSEHLPAAFEGPIEVFAKHGLQLSVYKMMLTLPDGQDWWSNEDPVAKHLMLVTLTSSPKEILGPFSKRLGHARQVALVQLLGDRLLPELDKGTIELSEELRRFWVFMPEEGACSKVGLSPAPADGDEMNKYIESWRRFLAALSQKKPSADVKLYLFKEPPYLGATFIDWDRPEGWIHVSPYIWGVPFPQSPGYELQWMGKRPSPVYETYVAGLEALRSISNSVLLG
jgi:hypothetical protein